MPAKVNNLFGINEGKSVRQLEHEKAYIDHGVDFEPIFQDALNITLNDPTPLSYRGRGYMAYHMNWNILGLLKERYPERMLIDKCDRLYYSLDPYTRVYFKKLNSKHAPENVTTEHVKELNSMSMFVGEDQITVLYAGFNIKQNEAWQELAGSYLVEMKNLRMPNWVSDLTELSYEISRKNIHVPITTITLPDEIILKPKSKEEDLGNISE